MLNQQKRMYPNGVIQNLKAAATKDESEKLKHLRSIKSDPPPTSGVLYLYQTFPLFYWSANESWWGMSVRVEKNQLKETDPEIYQAIQAELRRQNDNIELIASENFTSIAVLEAAGTVLTNKYAEGYPAKRWYGGCEHVDVVETLAQERAKALFGAEHVNVQPHSGSQANAAVYFSALSLGDTVLAMNLSHGGHLTHGHPMNFSGKFFKIVPYGVSPKDERIDYDEVESLALEHKPKMILSGASAYPRIIDFARFRKICDKVGAFLFVDMAHIAGLVAAGLHPSPIPHAEFVTTTTHKTLRGPRA